MTISYGVRFSGATSGTLDGETENYAEFTTAWCRISAYLIACIQSMHCIPDIMSHVVYYALAMNTRFPIRPRDIGSMSVIKQLRKQSDTSSLAQLLDDLTRQGQFKHLSALVNHSKHRSIIEPALNEDWTGKRAYRYKIFFRAFDYEDVHYPEVEARQFLSAEYDRISCVTLRAGNELNRLLGASTS